MLGMEWSSWNENDESLSFHGDEAPLDSINQVPQHWGRQKYELSAHVALRELLSCPPARRSPRASACFPPPATSTPNVVDSHRRRYDRENEPKLTRFYWEAGMRNEVPGMRMNRAVIRWNEKRSGMFIPNSTSSECLHGLAYVNNDE